jgi:hypothetical protein
LFAQPGVTSTTPFPCIDGWVIWPGASQYVPGAQLEMRPPEVETYEGAPP